jgi:hypothetical protein
MKIKTNLRAGSGANAGGVNAGGASGVGQNSKHTGVDPAQPADPVKVVPPVSRCVGL